MDLKSFHNLTVQTVMRGSIVYTDKFKRYDSLMLCGYRHLKIDHKKKLSSGKVYINKGTKIRDQIQMKKIEIIISAIENNPDWLLGELYGNDPTEREQQATRYLSLINKFRAFSEASEAALFTSPGRTEIGGNHTDHNYGRVLAGAVNLDNIAVAAPNGANIIHIQSYGYPALEVNFSSLQPDKSEQYTSSALVRGICARVKERGFKIGGFDACIDGGVPKGSGLSSSASFEVLIGAIINELFNGGRIDPIQNAAIGQYSENNYFGKPCGLMDQVACAMGGLIAIDFEDPLKPIVKKVNFDFDSTGFALVITDTGGSHVDLNDEYASIPADMKAVAAELGARTLRQTTLEQVLQIAPKLREKVGDRAILRAIHFHCDNQRVIDQVAALERNDFKAFLGMVIGSGYSSFMYNQNIFPVSNVREQGVSLALALSELVLKGHGAWRVHGGGFAGTIQAFVPKHLLDKYITALEHVYGAGSCHKLSIRKQGAGKVEI
jgi:galactokinase